mmetsp:Transcript_99780/g.307841  ORF Transcript_99780/g.307841 Transcript_99780/m.307841 type:complete len:215 (-) Transcript_99780:139-783(-)
MRSALGPSTAILNSPAPEATAASTSAVSRTTAPLSTDGGCALSLPILAEELPGPPGHARISSQKWIGSRSVRLSASAKAWAPALPQTSSQAPRMPCGGRWPHQVLHPPTNPALRRALTSVLRACPPSCTHLEHAATWGASALQLRTASAATGLADCLATTGTAAESNLHCSRPAGSPVPSPQYVPPGHTSCAPPGQWRIVWFSGKNGAMTGPMQ